MHLLYLGGVGWLLKQIIVGPALLAPRIPDAPNPVDVFNSALENDLWLPYSIGRLPPKIGQTNTRIKADQLKLLSRVMPVLFYLAMRDGDSISEIEAPRGTKSSTGGKHQVRRAKLLWKLRTKWFNSIKRPDLIPTLAECFPSRNLPRHYRQILRFSVALCMLDSKAISMNDAQYAQNLLQELCVEYTRMNVQLSPNFHYMQHLEESIFRFASLYNNHVWGMERANATVAKVNHNGRGKGVMEGTLMRGWWEHASLRSLIRRFESLPNRTPADEAIVEDLLAALRGGPEHAQQRGSLMAFIAQSRTAYARIHGVQDQTRLSNQSRAFKMDDGLWRLVVAHCDQVWPDEGIFGLDDVRVTYLPREGAVRNYSYVEHDAIRYGSCLHTSGRRACYGYIDGRQAVRVERILGIEIPDRADMRTICVVVRYFQMPEFEPDFPWYDWRVHLGIDHWEYNQLGELAVIPVSRFSGVFALMRVPMSYAEYWVTVALNSLEPEEERHRVDDNGDEWVNWCVHTL
ncbi:hypothetical protein FRC09_014663 [Ceratobasidium sp. 395]|nr:hypothetical protein FRC09_014663 [Ceratobasidium sp. 395]